MQSSIQASPQHHSFHGDATSKLQLMNLKAAAQKGGLDAASTGWAILEKLGTETDHGPEWNEIWNAISVGKVSTASVLTFSKQRISFFHDRLRYFYR